jgi:SAM-dependent methyltransferase
VSHAPAPTASSRAADVARETLKTFALTHNYNGWVVDLMRPYIGRRVLEIGCGIGNLTCYLQEFGDLSSLDVSELYLAHMRIDFPDVRFVQCDAASEQMPATAGTGFDTVVCVNVLEHIKDDARAVANFHEVLAPGGRLLIHVPALPWLYGSLDRELDHFRRYSRRQLVELLAGAGFEVERAEYCNLLATFGWFVNARLLGRRELSNWQTILFDKFVPSIERIERRLKPPFGMSLFVVARKT